VPFLPGLAGIAFGFSLIIYSALTNPFWTPDRSQKEFTKNLAPVPSGGPDPKSPAPENPVVNSPTNWDHEASVPIYSDRLLYYRTENIQMNLARPFVPSKRPFVRMPSRRSGDGGIVVVGGVHKPVSILVWKQRKPR
jgi:hypothetical protein